MPKDLNGNFQMNPQIARSKPKAAAANPAAQDPTAAAGQEESVTITKKADGTYSYSDSKGQTQDVPDYQSALAMQAQCFGEEGGDQDAQTQPDADQGAEGAAY